jgi:hypothetical protein
VHQSTLCKKKSPLEARYSDEHLPFACARGKAGSRTFGVAWRETKLDAVIP